MELTKCKTCGGDTEKNGHVYICVYCGNQWEEDTEDDINAVDRANAWGALRSEDFEKAQTEFENIIGKNNKDYEAWWGKALADNCITYVNDLQENKKVPTCNNITNEVFAESIAVKNACANAPAEIADGYRKMAAYIDKVRVEWLSLASKEPAYDVFISYKDSDKERGLERTQDSYDAQDLYNALIADGYKVFFSRVSLRDKISEQYEPYIYNAIKTAKVMIVFGEKPEYFSSTWIKNEWSRFRTRIEKKEKHKNSLVVVYKNMDPGELPSALRSRQCLNMADMTFLTDLNRHISRIIESEKQKAGLDRITIESGVIAKKAERLQTNEIQTKELKTGKTETDITTLQSLGLVDSYLSGEAWDRAASLIDQLLFDDPGNPESTWRLILCEVKAKNDNELIQKIDSWTEIQYERLTKVLDSATAEFATEKLKLLYSAIDYASDNTYLKLLEKIFVYKFSGRTLCINKNLAVSTNKLMYNTFCKLLTLLDSGKVDSYINYNMQYAGKNDSHSAECIERILAVDEGNADALWYKLQFMKDKDKLITGFENILKFSNDTDADVERFLKEADGDWLKIATRVIRYYKKDVKNLYTPQNILTPCADKLLSNSLFENAEEFYTLILSIDKDSKEAYWGVCLSKLHASNDSEVKYGVVLLSTIQEYSKYMVMVPEGRRQECIKLEAEQKEIYPIMEQATAVIKSANESGMKSLVDEKNNIEKELCSLDENIKSYENTISKFSILNKEYIELKNQVSENKNQIEKMSNERKSLGIFSGKRKKEIDSNISLLTGQIADNEKKIGEYDNAYCGMNLNSIVHKKDETIMYKQNNLDKLNNIKLQIDKNNSQSMGIFDRKMLIDYANQINIYSILKLINNIEKVIPGIVLAKKGSKVRFGEQEYLVLEKDGNLLFLISSDCVCKDKYNEYNCDITWEKCTIRRWLNTTYLNRNFSENDIKAILSTNLKNSDNKKYGTKGGNDTVDKIFLLSIDEVNKYFKSDDERIAKFDGSSSWWWLRSPGGFSYYAAVVLGVGSVNEHGFTVGNEYGIRPALWVDISNL